MVNYVYYGRFKVKESKIYKKIDLTTFRSMWAFPNKPKDWKGANCQFEKVGAEDIIIDIDADNLNDALDIMLATVDYLTEKYNDLILTTEKIEKNLIDKYLTGSDNIISEIEEPQYLKNIKQI